MGSAGRLMDFLSDVVRWFTTAEHWQGPSGITHRLTEHVAMSAAATVSAIVLALPVGLVLGHLHRWGGLAINISNVGRAIPSFALLVLAFQIFGLGPEPAYVALVALAVPPILTNAYVGVSEVDREVRETATAMGMSGAQVLFRVEAPMALPLIMAGVRTAGVQVVATATLAALVAWGGLGRFIVDGIAAQDDPRLFAGALLVAILSVATELGFALLQRLTLSPGLRAAHLPGKDTVSARPGAAVGSAALASEPSGALD
jgi:osmoprotectant transport system permease protein